VLRPRIRPLPALAFAPFDVITAGLLPEGLRRAYGLSWGGVSRALFGAAAATLPRLLGATTSRLRVVPAARLAEQRENAKGPALT